MVDGPEPCFERQFGGSENRPGGYRGLGVTIRTLEKFPVPHDTVFATATAGTLKAIRPAPFHKMRPATLIGSEPLIESSLAHTLLKLDRISSHR